ncbi:hypothetical protein E5D57_013288 [Metarhizium anisopliae]|nr:hypothetical protein E5D57_013288 [Metarhizium anisopliae]
MGQDTAATSTAENQAERLDTEHPLQAKFTKIKSKKIPELYTKQVEFLEADVDAYSELKGIQRAGCMVTKIRYDDEGPRKYVCLVRNQSKRRLLKAVKESGKSKGLHGSQAKSIRRAVRDRATLWRASSGVVKASGKFWRRIR